MDGVNTSNKRAHRVAENGIVFAFLENLEKLATKCNIEGKKNHYKGKGSCFQEQKAETGTFKVANCKTV